MQENSLKLSKGVAALCALSVSSLSVNASSAQDAQSTNRVEALLQLAQVESKNQQTKSSRDDRPNILIIVADDMGWSDIGPYGSEIIHLAYRNWQTTVFC